MTTYPTPICLVCRHYTGDRREPNGDYTPLCAAFPAGIPDAIWQSARDHREAYEGDGGVRFAPKNQEAADYAALVFNNRDRRDGTGEEDDA